MFTFAALCEYFNPKPIAQLAPVEPARTESVAVPKARKARKRRAGKGKRNV